MTDYSWWEHSNLVTTIVKMLRDSEAELDDNLVRVIREVMAEPVATEPDQGGPGPDVIDRGGAEPIDQHWTVQGEIGVKQPEQTIRERVT